MLRRRLLQSPHASPLIPEPHLSGSLAWRKNSCCTSLVIASSAILLFAIGRSVGLIGHAIEQQYQLDEAIHPRARYTGPPPG